MRSWELEFSNMKQNKREQQGKGIKTKSQHVSLAITILIIIKATSHACSKCGSQMHTHI